MTPQMRHARTFIAPTFRLQLRLRNLYGLTGADSESPESRIERRALHACSVAQRVAFLHCRRNVRVKCLIFFECCGQNDRPRITTSYTDVDLRPDDAPGGLDSPGGAMRRQIMTVALLQNRRRRGFFEPDPPDTGTNPSVEIARRVL